MDDKQTSLVINEPSATMSPDASAVPAVDGHHSGTSVNTLAPNRIMNLPPEIRIMLYRAVFEVDRFPTFAAALTKIRSEALPVYYEDLRLKIDIGHRVNMATRPQRSLQLHAKKERTRFY